MKYVTRFGISGPFYYVLLYIQLVLICPFLYKLFEYADTKKTAWNWEFFFMLLVLVVSGLTTNYTNILSVYGGGGKLFGGTYLFLFYIGMWFGKYYHKIQMKRLPAIILFEVGVVLTIFWWSFIAANGCKIDIYFPFGDGKNPPSVTFSLYAILWAITLYSAQIVLDSTDSKIMKEIFSGFAYMGKHTLYIFLYHRFFLDIVFVRIRNNLGIEIEIAWLRTIVYFGCMILGSYLIEILFEKLHGFLKEAYGCKNTRN